jgi:hypothetical protein
MNWLFTVPRIIIVRTHIKTTTLDSYPFDITIIRNALANAITVGITATTATRLPTNRIRTANAAGAVFKTTLALGIASPGSSAAATRLPTYRIRATNTTGAVLHTLALARRIASSGSNTDAT